MQDAARLATAPLATASEAAKDLGVKPRTVHGRLMHGPDMTTEKGRAGLRARLPRRLLPNTGHTEGSNPNMDTTQRTRYEIPAVIVVDAVDQEDAWTRARNLSATLAAKEGPGAFFFEIGVAPTNKPRTADDLEDRDTVEQHVESIRSAVGDDWVWDE